LRFNGPVISDEAVRSCLARDWGLPRARVVVHDGGMNSATWFVDDGERRWVAKSVVPGSRDQFVAGLKVAARLQRKGIPAGAPVPTAGGEDVVDVGGYPLALLSWVAGDELTWQDQPLIGATLARVHRALAGESVEGEERFHWVDPGAAHLGMRPWVRPAVAAAVEAIAAVDTMSWGLLHTDPSPEAFRLDPATGVCGVIDWGVAMSGPLLYDLASAVMYVGGPGELVEAYLREGVLTRSEVERGLEPMRRFRWAVQADYFARRIATNDLTGIDGPQGNEDGLRDAEIALT
jgi:homoserine kinase type II